MPADPTVSVPVAPTVSPATVTPAAVTPAPVTTAPATPTPTPASTGIGALNQGHPGATFKGLNLNVDGTPYYPENTGGFVPTANGEYTRINSPKMGSDVSTYKVTQKNPMGGRSQGDDGKLQTLGVNEEARKPAKAEIDAEAAKVKLQQEEAAAQSKKAVADAGAAKELLLKQIITGGIKDGKTADGRSVIGVLGDLNKALGRPLNDTNGIFVGKL